MILDSSNNVYFVLVKSNLGFILQARSGSTRLPNKVLMPLYQSKGILELILESLKEHFKNIPIIVATTDNSLDDEIEVLSIKKGVKVYRGSEDNVLQRMKEAAELFQIDHIVRVCADNPMLDMDSIQTLIQTFEEKESDYMSFETDDKVPVIKSHFGLFVEIVKRTALEKALRLTQEKLYLEHVTNFIYGNPDRFDVELIPLPPYIGKRKDLRFTIDNAADFSMCMEILDYYNGLVPNLNDLIQWVDSNGFPKRMMNEINKYQK